MITLYAAYNIPFDGKGRVRDFRVLWALEELGLPYTCHWMDAGKGEHKIDPNRSVNPFGKIPVDYRRQSQALRVRCHSLLPL